jgi:hypothetical protein
LHTGDQTDPLHQAIRQQRIACGKFGQPFTIQNKPLSQEVVEIRWGGDLPDRHPI